MNKDSATLVTVSIKVSVGVVSQEYSYFPEEDSYYKKDWCKDYMGGGYIERTEVPEDMLKYFNNFKGV